MWRTKPKDSSLTRTNLPTKAHETPGNQNQEQSGTSFMMIFASIFGSVIAISLMQRLWPRRVEVVHKRQDENFEQFPPPGPYRSV